MIPVHGMVNDDVVDAKIPEHLPVGAIRRLPVENRGCARRRRWDQSRAEIVILIPDGQDTAGRGRAGLSNGSERSVDRQDPLTERVS